MRVAIGIAVFVMAAVLAAMFMSSETQADGIPTYHVGPSLKASIFSGDRSRWFRVPGDCIGTPGVTSTEVWVINAAESDGITSRRSGNSVRFYGKLSYRPKIHYNGNLGRILTVGIAKSYRGIHPDAGTNGWPKTSMILCTAVDQFKFRVKDRAPGPTPTAYPESTPQRPPDPRPTAVPPRPPVWLPPVATPRPVPTPVRNGGVCATYKHTIHPGHGGYAGNPMKSARKGGMPHEHDLYLSDGSCGTDGTNPPH